MPLMPRCQVCHRLVDEYLDICTISGWTASACSACRVNAVAAELCTADRHDVAELTRRGVDLGSALFLHDFLSIVAGTAHTAAAQSCVSLAWPLLRVLWPMHGQGPCLDATVSHPPQCHRPDFGAYHGSPLHYVHDATVGDGPSRSEACQARPHSDRHREVCVDACNGEAASALDVAAMCTTARQERALRRASKRVRAPGVAAPEALQSKRRHLPFPVTENLHAFIGCAPTPPESPVVRRVTSIFYPALGSPRMPLGRPEKKLICSAFAASPSTEHLALHAASCDSLSACLPLLASDSQPSNAFQLALPESVKGGLGSEPHNQLSIELPLAAVKRNRSTGLLSFSMCDVGTASPAFCSPSPCSADVLRVAGKNSKGSSPHLAHGVLKVFDSSTERLPALSAERDSLANLADHVFPTSDLADTRGAGFAWRPSLGPESDDAQNWVADLFDSMSFPDGVEELAMLSSGALQASTAPLTPLENRSSGRFPSVRSGTVTEVEFPALVRSERHGVSASFALALNKKASGSVCATPAPPPLGYAKLREAEPVHPDLVALFSGQLQEAPASNANDGKGVDAYGGGSAGDLSSCKSTSTCSTGPLHSRAHEVAV